MSGIDDEVAEVQAVIDGLRARLEAALVEVDKARIDPTGPGHHKARRWARGEERRYTLRWLRAHGNLNACEAADSIEAGEHRPEGRHGVPSEADWSALEARADAAEARVKAARAEGKATGAALTRARIADDIFALGAEPDQTGQRLTPRMSPATLLAIQDVARKVAAGGDT